MQLVGFVTLPEFLQLKSAVLARMPDRAPYPKPRVVIHESAEAMITLFGPRHKHEAETGYPASMTAMLADPDTNTVHVPYGELQLNTADDVLRYFLHELGHLYYAKRDGVESANYDSEAKAWKFSRTWRKKLKDLVE